MEDKIIVDPDGIRKNRIERTRKVVLVANDGTTLPVGDFTLTEIEPGPTNDQFADHAFKSARASLSKLMVPQYRLVVIEPNGSQQGYGLERWVKLTDGEALEKQRLQGQGPKQRLRNKAA